MAVRTSDNFARLASSRAAAAAGVAVAGVVVPDVPVGVSSPASSVPRILSIAATSLPQVLADAFELRSRTVRRRLNSATCVFARALRFAVVTWLRAVRAWRSCSCAAAFSPCACADAGGSEVDCVAAGGCAVLCAADAGGSASSAAAVAVTVHAAVERFISVAPLEEISAGEIPNSVESISLEQEKSK